MGGSLMKLWRIALRNVARRHHLRLMPAPGTAGGEA